MRPIGIKSNLRSTEVGAVRPAANRPPAGTKFQANRIRPRRGTVWPQAEQRRLQSSED